MAGRDNRLERPVYLLPLETQNLLCVDATTGGTLTLPEVPGFALTVEAGSATFPGGTQAGCLTVTPVHADKVPMTPNFGQQPRFIVTIQPAGVLFDPPAALSLPNADGLAPGTVTELYSFDHDLGRFVAIGTATVSADGIRVQSDPGVGVVKAGWVSGGDPEDTGDAENVSVSVNPGQVFVSVGGTALISASGGPAPAGSPAFAWSSQDEATATVSFTSAGSASTGTITGVAPGTTNVTVQYRAQSGQTSAPATVQVTTVQIQSVGWVGIDPGDGTNLTNDNPSAGGGFRLFPGKNMLNGPAHRDVLVRAVVEPKVAGVEVLFASIDVDDPTATTGPIDNESLQQDNRGGPGTLSGQLATTDANGVAEVVLTVPMNPGDNVRVVAAAASDDLSAVSARQNDLTGTVIDGNGNSISDDTTTLAPVKATPMLTVWRKLHVEVNSMGAEPAGTVFDPEDAAGNGDLFRGDVPDPDTSFMTAAYEKAFILVDFSVAAGAGFNDSDTRWELGFPNGVSALKIYAREFVDFPIAGTGKDPDFWTAYLLGIYEYGFSVGTLVNDPNSAVGSEGLTLLPGSLPEKFSIIAFEVLRDVAAQFGWSTMEKDFVGARATAHEVAHLFGLGHNGDQNSLMFAPDEQTQSQSPGFGTLFLDDEIDKIRKFGVGQTP